MKKVPFDFPASRHGTMHGFLDEIRKFYGVKDPHHFYRAYRKRIVDKCKPDPFRVGQFESLEEFWESSKLAYHYLAADKEQDVVAMKPGCNLYQTSTTRVYKAEDGECLVTTEAQSLEQFVSDFVDIVVDAHRKAGASFEADMRAVIGNCIPIAFKLAGYKADRVVERKQLACGFSQPETERLAYIGGSVGVDLSASH